MIDLSCNHDFTVSPLSESSGKDHYFGGLRLPQLGNPKSAYQGNVPPLPISDERSVLEDILVCLAVSLQFTNAWLTQQKAEGKAHVENSCGHETFTEAHLEGFSIYRPHKPFNWGGRNGVMEEKALSNEFISLHRMYQPGESFLCMDGILSYGGKKRYVQRVPFKILSIGGYEDRTVHTVGSEIWIQSVLGQESDVWYRLRSPAPEYDRFHRPFLWVADLAKHAIDFMNQHRRVSLFRFRSQFFDWLRAVHGLSDVFQSWHSDYNDTDFRRAVACHSGFLYYQSTQLDPKYASHPLWAETDAEALNAIPKQTAHLSSTTTSSTTKTVVTPYVFRCFEHLPFARFLDPQVPAPPVLAARHQNDLATTLIGRGPRLPLARNHELEKDPGRHIQMGDVIAIKPEKESSWKHNDPLWYGYVHGTQDMKKGTALKILWLYRPTDTACQKMKYPFRNELFLSDHCNCHDERIYASEVVARPNVAFFAGPDTDAEYFVRQKYVGSDAAWVTLHKSDFECSCKAKNASPAYSLGDTLLVATETEGVLEAVEVIEKAPDADEGHLRVRRLLRRARDYGHEDAEPNELVYTTIFEVISTKDVLRSCKIRFYTTEDKRQCRIPPQYRRGGTGDFYYIMYHHAQDNESLVPLTEPWPTSIKQGWDPTDPAEATPSVMRGLDIFCGGGNLGRGLEEGGAVKFEWAVDYFKEAIHTYRANLKHPDDAKLFYGSVNDYLSQAMRGTGEVLVAQAGTVDVISAGSPCQGFSTANHHKIKDQALLNISMVASVVSFVDFYRPKYALLENVTAMAKCNAKDSDQNVFAQVLSALVGMGYQVRSFILDAWNFGSPQSRTRLFISIAAPGLEPLPNPPQSHSHPDTIGARSLGKSANGLTLADRYWGLTPFRYLTIGEATKDLPLNFDGRVDCIAFPDHRTTRPLSTINRVRISCIPRYPPGMNFVRASLLGIMPPPQMSAFNWNADKRAHVDGRAWKRVIKDGLISTVTTACQPDDGLCGAWLHWEASRCITVMEARRAQGFPDEEVIVGIPRHQWKIVGNSVARPVAFALGLALRTAWLTNFKELGSGAVPRPSDFSVCRERKVNTGPGKRAEVRCLKDPGPNHSRSDPASESAVKAKVPLRPMTRTISATSDDLIFISTSKRVRSLSPELRLEDSPRKRQRTSEHDSRRNSQRPQSTGHRGQICRSVTHDKIYTLS